MTAPLSPVQILVLRQLAEGRKPVEVVDALPAQFRVSVHGIDYHIRQIHRKFNVTTTIEAVRMATLRRMI